MPRTSAANMKCPRSEHAGSRVKLDGTYGKPGHRRQRYTCLPGGGGKPHVFTELLPREESPGTARANTASGSSSDAKDPRRLATTSSLPGESRRRCKQWAPAAPTCGPLA